MINIKINLNNRDGAKLYLVSTDITTEDGRNFYKFEVDEEHEYILKYMRCGYNENGSIAFVDPSGGPFIEVGSNITHDLIVDSIIDVDNELLFSIYCNTI